MNMQYAGGERDEEIERSRDGEERDHVLLYSPNVPSGWHWLGAELGTRNSTQGFHEGHIPEPSPLPLKVYTGKKLK